MLKFTALLLLLVSTITFAAGKSESPENLLEDSQRQFYRNDHDGALGTLQKYFAKLTQTPKKKVKAKLRFLAIAAMGRIYLQYKQDPKGAIEWFEKMSKGQGLNEAEQDIVDGWISAAKDWQKLGKKTDVAPSEKDLYETGKKFYDSGLKKQKYPMDPAGTADFSIASTYLVPFMVHFDKSPHIGEVLYMMGDMRRRLWSNNEFWSENTYLSETIRRFPDTTLAVKAYDALKEDVQFAYSGSGGEHVPESWKTTLSVLSDIAHGKDNSLPIATPSSSPSRIN
jgi:hypothetical protein